LIVSPRKKVFFIFIVAKTNIEVGSEVEWSVKSELEILFWSQRQHEELRKKVYE
jgi:hypothetical protein